MGQMHSRQVDGTKVEDKLPMFEEGQCKLHNHTTWKSTSTANAIQLHRDQQEIFDLKYEMVKMKKIDNQNTELIKIMYQGVSILAQLTLDTIPLKRLFEEAHPKRVSDEMYTMHQEVKAFKINLDRHSDSHAMFEDFMGDCPCESPRRICIGDRCTEDGRLSGTRVFMEALFAAAVFNAVNTKFQFYVPTTRDVNDCCKDLITQQAARPFDICLSSICPSLGGEENLQYLSLKLNRPRGLRLIPSTLSLHYVAHPLCCMFSLKEGLYSADLKLQQTYFTSDLTGGNFKGSDPLPEYSAAVKPTKDILILKLSKSNNTSHKVPHCKAVAIFHESSMEISIYKGKNFCSSWLPRVQKKEKSMIQHKEKKQKCKPESIRKKIHVEEGSTLVDQVPPVEDELQSKKSSVQVGKKKRLLKSSWNSQETKGEVKSQKPICTSVFLPTYAKMLYFAAIGGQLFVLERTRAFNLIEVARLLMESK
eukprot:Gb_13197 [translate_table: standard]